MPHCVNLKDKIHLCIMYICMNANLAFRRELIGIQCGVRDYIFVVKLYPLFPDL